MSYYYLNADWFTPKLSSRMPFIYDQIYMGQNSMTKLYGYDRMTMV